MADIVASTSRTIKWISKGGTYTAQLICRSGDIWLRYTGDKSTTTDIYPVWTAEMANGPEILLYIMSSKASEGLLTPKEVPTFYFNGSPLSFNASTGISTGEVCPGLFKLVYPSENDDKCYGLKMLDSAGIFKAAQGVSCTIRATATVTLGSGSSTYEDEIECSYNITIMQETTNGYVVTIAFENEDTDSRMAITSKTDELILVAKVYKGSDSEITPGYCVWSKADTTSSTGWTQLQVGSSNRLTVNEGMVNTKSTFRVQAWSAQNGTEYGQDIQDVMDLSDPFEIEANPTPKDETVVQYSNTGVKYTPILHTRQDTAKIAATFNWAVYDCNKNLIDIPDGQSGTGVTTFEVTYGMVEQANGDVSLVIEAVESAS